MSIQDVEEINFERLSKTWELLDETKNVVDQITDTAIEDGYLDEDEVILINTISESITKYQQLLRQILDDHQVTEEEYNQLREYEYKLVKEAYSQVREDGLVSIEEEEIINTLFKCLSNLEQLENL